MSDYNDFLLPDPCLRMDTHFGDEYESVEFGDGTGYVKAAPTLARLGALHVELDELRDENARLRSCLTDDVENARLIMAENAKLREFVADLMAYLKEAEQVHSDSLIPDLYYDRARGLGVEVTQ